MVVLGGLVWLWGGCCECGVSVVLVVWCEWCGCECGVVVSVWLWKGCGVGC